MLAKLEPRIGAGWRFGAQQSGALVQGLSDTGSEPVQLLSPSSPRVAPGTMLRRLWELRDGAGAKRPLETASADWGERPHLHSVAARARK